MNEFSNEINEIYKLAGVQINEEQGYFTDWNNIRNKVIKMYIRGRLEETGYLETEEEVISSWLSAYTSADTIKKLCDACGVNEENDNVEYLIAEYINKNANDGGIISKVVYEFVGDYFDRIVRDLEFEFKESNLIYRMIDSDKSPKEIAQILKTNGTGNCWAKQEENANSYYGNGYYNEYCLIGEATMDNVNWETTVYLRMMAEYENEVRLRKDSPIHIVGIKYYHYNEDNKLDKQDHMKVDLNLNVGHSYVFEESKQINESIKLVNKDSSDTKLITSPYELNNYLKNNQEARIVYDIKNNWYLIGNPENSIHKNLINDAFVDGYYQPFEYNGKTINPVDELEATGGGLIYNLNSNNFVLFRTSSDELNGEEYYYDRYKYCYVYNDYCVFDRNMEFKKTSLYNLLGEPNELNFIGDIDGDELDESIAYASKKDLSDIILKNPTRKELRDNGLESCRYMFEDDNTYYFADAKEYSHLDLAQLFIDKFKNYNLHTDGGYYNVKNNCFYIRNDFGCEKNKERLDNTKLLHKLFGNFKSIIYEGDYPEEWDGEDDEEELDESIVYASNKELKDIILKNPTKRELRDNHLVKCRCIEDSEGNWYFTDMENMLHAYVVYELRDEASFPLFDGNDCYGIAYYDAESNEFWYNLNDYMYREECVEQYEKSEYLRTTFPNARINRNPYGDFEDEYEEDYEDVDYEQLTEEIIHAEKSNYDDYMAVVLKNPTKRELRENGLDRSRFICFEDGTWLFFDSMQWIHAHIWDKYKDKFNGSNNMGFYDLSNNEFIFIESLDYGEDEEGYEEEVSYYENKCKKWLLTKPYIRETFGLNPNVTIYGDWVDNPW